MKVVLSKCKNPCIRSDMLNQILLYLTPKLYCRCYFHFDDTLEPIMIKNTPKTVIIIGCQYDKWSYRKQGERDVFVFAIQNFNRENCVTATVIRRNDITLLIYFLSCRSQEIPLSSLKAICKAFWVENESTLGFRLAPIKQQYS